MRGCVSPCITFCSANSFTITITISFIILRVTYDYTMAILRSNLWSLVFGRMSNCFRQSSRIQESTWIRKRIPACWSLSIWLFHDPGFCKMQNNPIKVQAIARSQFKLPSLRSSSKVSFMNLISSWTVTTKFRNNKSWNWNYRMSQSSSS